MAELEDLVVSGEQLDRKFVADILSSYVQLDKDKSTIRPTEEWERLSAEEKILVYLLARKAMVALKFGIAEEASASEITTDTGIKKGTAHPTLRKLAESSRLLQQTADRKYFVPNHAITRVKIMLE